MTSNDFTIWLKGFVTACNEYSPTPKQWDIIKEELEKVEDKTLILESPKFPFGTPNTYPTPIGVPYTPYDPYNPFKITCSSGSFGTITTTPGTGYITTYNPIQFGTGSATYTPSSATYGYPIGSAWSYTTSNEKVF